MLVLRFQILHLRQRYKVKNIKSFKMLNVNAAYGDDKDRGVLYEKI